MKKILLIVLLTSFSWGFGQNLSLSQLMSLRTMDLDDMEIFLTQKGWHFKGATEATETRSSFINFIYSTNNNLQYGEAFLSLIGGDTIWLQISKKSKYLEYYNAVKSFKPTLIDSVSQDGYLVKKYQGATTTFEFETGTSKDEWGNSGPSWYLTIYENSY